MSYLQPGCSKGKSKGGFSRGERRKGEGEGTLTAPGCYDPAEKKANYYVQGNGAAVTKGLSEHRVKRPGSDEVIKRRVWTAPTQNPDRKNDAEWRGEGVLHL